MKLPTEVINSTQTIVSVPRIWYCAYGIVNFKFSTTPNSITCSSEQNGLPTSLLFAVHAAVVFVFDSFFLILAHHYAPLAAHHHFALVVFFIRDWLEVLCGNFTVCSFCPVFVQNKSGLEKVHFGSANHRPTWLNQATKKIRLSKHIVFSAFRHKMPSFENMHNIPSLDF